MADVVEVALAVVDGAAVEDGVMVTLETTPGRTTVTNEEDEAPADAMAAAEKQAGAAKGPAFVAAKSNPNIAPQEAAPAQANEDEIQIDDEEF